MRGLTLLFWTLIFTILSVELMKVQAAEDKFAYSFSSRPAATPDIYVVDGEGGEPIQLTDDWRWNQWPAWSPDGHLLAFISHGRLVVMDADRNRRNIAVGRFRPAWSPDGRQIAVMKGLSLWIFDVETHRGRELHGTQVSMAPTWSRDGLQLAFRSDLFAEGNWDLYLIDTNGQNPRRLTVDPGDDHYPAWSPEGSEIAFSSDRSGKSQIYVMDMIRDNKIRQLTDLPFSGQGPVWSPAGDQIAFGGWKGDDLESVGLYVVDAKGGKPILRVAGPGGPPAWGRGPVRFTADPQEKAVDPREKLGTTWGVIKRSN